MPWLGDVFGLVLDGNMTSSEKTNKRKTMQRRLSETTVESQLWATDLFDALEFLQGKTIGSVTRVRKASGDADEIIILSFTDETFAEFHGLADWGEQRAFVGVAFSDIEGVEG
jgi:hypothetical protein